MSTDQSPHEPTDRSSSRAGLVVGVIGVLLVIVVLCGLQLRNADKPQPPIRTGSNLTSPPSGASGANGGLDPSTSDASLDSPALLGEDGGETPSQPASGQVETSIDDSPTATAQSDTGGPTPPKPNAGTRLAALEPLELEGIEGGANGPWRSATLSGKRYEQALCVAPSSGQSSSQVEFSLDGKFDQLGGLAGLQDASDESPHNGASRTSVVFRIYGDANLLWDTDPLTSPGQAERFQVDVAGLDYLTFVVEVHSAAIGVQPVWADLHLMPTSGNDDAENGDLGQP